MTNDYCNAWDQLAAAIGADKGLSTTTVFDVDHLSTDQRLKVVEIQALLSIAQEINHLRHMGMNPEFDNGL